MPGKLRKRRWLRSCAVCLGIGGTGTSVVVHGLTAGHTYTVVAYTVDTYGNVSSPVERSVTF